MIKNFISENIVPVHIRTRAGQNKEYHLTQQRGPVSKEHVDKSDYNTVKCRYNSHNNKTVLEKNIHYQGRENPYNEVNGINDPDIYRVTPSSCRGVPIIRNRFRLSEIAAPGFIDPFLFLLPYLLLGLPADDIVIPINEPDNFLVGDG